MYTNFPIITTERIQKYKAIAKKYLISENEKIRLCNLPSTKDIQTVDGYLKDDAYYP